MWKSPIRFSAPLLVLAVTATLSVAQTATGDIVGIVTDSQGAVIVEASVTAEAKATRYSRATMTNGSGIFSFTLLPPSQYRITVSVPKMNSGTAEMELLVGDHLKVNFILRPASISTDVQVSAQPMAIDTTSSEIKYNIDPQQIASLPLYGRTFSSLAILAPGVRPAFATDGPISISGSNGRNFNLTVDGGENKDNTLSTFLQNYTTEGIQEFAVKTYNFGADTGKSDGAVIEIVTKGGTNNLHGGIFFVVRNRNLEATDFFTAHPTETATCDRVPSACYTGPSNPKPGFDRQNYGGTLGGPILHNRWFFYGAIEHVHENAPLPQNGQTIDTIKAFRTLQLQGAVADPRLASATLDPSPSIAKPFRDTQWQVRSDVSLTPRHQLFLRFAVQDNRLSHDLLDGFEDPAGGAETTNRLKSFLVNHSFAVSPRTFNQFVFQFSDSLNRSLPEAAGAGIPNVSFANGVSIGQNLFAPDSSFQRKFQFKDDFTWQKGKHLVRFGFQDAVVTRFGGSQSQFPTPFVNVRCVPQQILLGGTDPCGIGFDYTGLDQPGIVGRTRLSIGDNSYSQPIIQQISYYVQDDWKISPRLTLNLGVRNDLDLGLIPTSSQIPSPDAAPLCILCSGNRTLRILGLLPPASLQKIVPNIDLNAPHNDVNNYAPRVGFAWDVTGSARWVVRGGYGMFFGQFFQEAQIVSLLNAGNSVYAVSRDARTPANPSLPNSIGLSAAIAAAGPFPVASLTDLPYGSRGWLLDPRLRQPYAEHISLGSELKLKNSLTLIINVVHVLSLHGYSESELDPSLDGSIDTRILNTTLDPVFGCRDSAGASILCSAQGAAHRLFRVVRTESGNRSRYDALTVQLFHRFSSRFQFNAWYVLSRAYKYGGGIADSDFLSFTQGAAPGMTPTRSASLGIIQPQNFGYTNQDERHRVVFYGIGNLPHGILLSGILQLASARPYSMSAGDDLNGDGVPNDLYSPIVTRNPVFDPVGEGDVRFAVRPNSLRGMPYFQTDLRGQKDFRAKEGVVVSVFADVFNVFNRANFGNQFVSSSDGFGAAQPPVPVNTGRTGPQAANLPRKPIGLSGPPFQAQLGLRVQF